MKIEFNMIYLKDGIKAETNSPIIGIEIDEKFLEV